MNRLEIIEEPTEQIDVRDKAIESLKEEILRLKETTVPKSKYRELENELVDKRGELAFAQDELDKQRNMFAQIERERDELKKQLELLKPTLEDLTKENYHLKELVKMKL